MALRPENKDVGNLFELPVGYTYSVPDFQRPSSWNSEVATTFIVDLIDSFNYNEKGFFLGNIIILENDKIQEREIIDGQQRFLNITILLAVIRDIIKHIKSDDPIVEFIDLKINKQMLSDISNDLEKIPLLRPEVENKEFFKKYIQQPIYEEFNGKEKLAPILNMKKKDSKYYDYYLKEIKKTTNESFIDNYSIYYKYITDPENKIYDIDSADKTLSNIKNFLNEAILKIEFVLLIVTDEIKADEIFESVNSKNVKLTSADLIKSKVFSSSRKLNDEVKLHKTREDWDEMQDNLRDINFDLKKLISYYWSSEYGYVSDRRLFTEMKKEFDSNTREIQGTYEKWNSLLQELLACSKDLYNILTPTSEEYNRTYFENKNPEGLRKSHNIVELITTLSASKQTQCYIMLFTILRNLREGKYVDEASFKTLRNNLRWFVDFTFLYFDILRKPSNWYHKLICQVARSIDNHCDNPNITKEDKKQAIQREWFYLAKNFSDFLTTESITKDQLSAELIEKLTYKQKDKILLRFFITRVEHHMGDKDLGMFTPDTDVEHILPQSPISWGLERKDISKYVHKIGNLILTGPSINSKLGNKTFDDKCNLVSEAVSENNVSIRPLVKQVFIDKKWDFNTCSGKNFSPIEKRSNELSQIAYEIWIEKLKNTFNSLAQSQADTV